MQEIQDPVPGRYRTLYPKRAFAMAGRRVEVACGLRGTRAGGEARQGVPGGRVAGETGREERGTGPVADDGGAL